MSVNNDYQFVELTPENVANYGFCGYKDVEKHLELRNKIAWFKNYFQKGLRIKAFVTKADGYQGMIEYIPGQYAFRPVKAEGYYFIHCLFVGFKSAYKGKGCAKEMLEQVIMEAKTAHMKGVAVVVRKGSFMAKRDIFLKLGFISVDTAKPDFELLVYKFNEEDQNPSFINNDDVLSLYKNGLTVIRSAQCPYTEKNVKEILQTARDKYGLSTQLVDINSAEEAQKSPSPFGSFCLILNGKVIAYAPISNGRFVNIMAGIK